MKKVILSILFLATILVAEENVVHYDNRKQPVSAIKPNYPGKIDSNSSIKPNHPGK